MFGDSCLGALRIPSLNERYRAANFATDYTHFFRSRISIPISRSPLLPVRLNTYGRRAFSVSGPMVWNSLPDFLSEKERREQHRVTVSDVYSKCTCSRDVSASIALGVLNDNALALCTV